MEKYIKIIEFISSTSQYFFIFYSLITILALGLTVRKLKSLKTLEKNPALTKFSYNTNFSDANKQRKSVINSYYLAYAENKTKEKNTREHREIIQQFLESERKLIERRKILMENRKIIRKFLRVSDGKLTNHVIK